MQYVGEHYQSGKYFISRPHHGRRDLPRGHGDPRAAAAAPPDSRRSDTGVGRRSSCCCTVRGDIHDIGKNIVVTLLRSYGFTVHDLGVDVPPAEVARQVRRARARRRRPVGSAHGRPRQHEGDGGRAAALRASPATAAPIIIGGGAVDEQVRAWTGADLWADDAVRGVELIRDRLSCL